MNKDLDLIRIDCTYHYPEDWDEEEGEYEYTEGGYGSVVINPENPYMWAIIKGKEYDHISDYYMEKMIKSLGSGPYTIEDLESSDMENLFSTIYSNEVNTLDCRITIDATPIKLSEIDKIGVIETSLPSSFKIEGISEIRMFYSLIEGEILNKK